LSVEDDSTDATLVSRLALQIGAAVGTLAFGLLIISGAFEFPVGWTERGPDPGYFPFWIGCVIVAGSLGTLVETLARRRALIGPAITREQGRRALAFLLPMVAFVALTSVLGIYVAMVLYLAFVMVAQGGYRLDVSCAVAIGTALLFYLMFDRWLKVPLAKGPIEAWLKLH